MKGECTVVREYYDNIILGKWVFSYSIFSGFIGEQNCLNELAKLIFGKPLFLKSYDKDKRPRQFTFFFMPTLRNYLDFVLLLDKMISDNINKDFLKGKIELDELVPSSDGVFEKRSKGTLRIFEEWFKGSYNVKDDAEFKKLFDVFRQIRKERQSPAHKITENEYNKAFNNDQLELITKAYHAMKTLRHAFGTHRAVKDFEVPKWLNTGRIVPF